MMKMRKKTTEMSQINGGSTVVNGLGDGAESTPSEWEMRPGGMLVQKRSDSDQNSVPPPTIRVRVKYGSIYHDIYISSQATFGELKKMLVGPTALHHQDQKLMFKDKERDSKAFLDTCGVKDRSKVVLLEDPIGQEKRLLEMRRNAKMEKACKSISDISLEVDRLAGRVSALESVIFRGGKVAETDMLSLIELLMNQLLKLDGIMGDGDVKLQRKMQVRRVQKCVETLDMLKLKNSPPASNGVHNHHHAAPIKAQQRSSNGHNQPPPRHSNGLKPIVRAVQEQQGSDSSIESSPTRRHAQPRDPSSGNVVITTNWETFDSAPATAASAPATAASAPAMVPVQPRFTWDLL